jgi:hypothetical protein
LIKKKKIIPFYSIILLPVKMSLVVKKSELNRALNVIHGEILGCKKINIAIFGHGLGGNVD